MTATRLYLPSSGSAAVSPTFDAFWDRTTNADSRPCSTSKANTANLAKNPGNETFGVVSDIPCVQFVSAQTIPANATIGTGTFSAVVKCSESSSTADAILQMTIRVVNGAGTTVRGTMYAGQSATTTVTTVGALNQEFGTAANAGTRIFSGVSLSSVSAQTGDRIVIELGWRACNVSGAGVSGSLFFGDLTADADHALVAVNNATLSPDLSPWVEFSEDLFTAVIPSGTAAGTYDFTGSSTGSKPSKGTASGTYDFTGSSAGKSPNRGTAAGGYDFSGTAAGIMGDVPTEGTAAGGYDFSGTAVGEAAYEGTASGGYAFGGTAAGSSPNSGTASGGYDFSGTAEGVNNLIPSGTAAGGYDFTGTATGVRPFVPDTTHLDRAAGMRYRTGGGHARITVPVDPEPEVVPSPVAAITRPVAIVADTLPAFTSDAAGLLEPVEATVEDGEWGRFRVRVGNKDVTFFRGIPMPQPTYQLTDPYGWGPATVTLPSVFFTDIGDDSDLTWLRKGAPVQFDQVVSGAVESTVYMGKVDAINVTALGTVELECSGALSGVLAGRWRPQDLTRGTADLSFLLSVAIEGQLARSYVKTPGWYTNGHDGRIGIEAQAYEGGMTWLAFVDKLLAESITVAGNSWTLLPDADDEIDLVERDLETVAATIYVGGRGVSAPLVDDSAESPNRFYAEGVDSDGSHWRNAFYPQTTAALDSDGDLTIPDYPFNDNATFGLGTTNADTDTGDGILVLQNELIGSGVGFRLLDREDLYNQATVDAIQAVQRNAGLTVTGNVNPATWTVLMGDAASTWSLGQAIIRPLVVDPRTERFLYNQNGSVIGRNPAHDRSIQPIDVHKQFPPGWSKERARRWCLREYTRSQRAQWRGTINLTSDVIAGDHDFGDAGTAMSRLDLRPGQNVRVKGFGSTNGVVMHVASIDVSGGDTGPSVTLAVDCQGRPAVDLAAILQRHQESRGDFARRAFLEHTRGSIQSEAIVGPSKEDGFGVVRRTRLTGGTWNQIQVIGGQSGTLQGIKLRTYDDAAEYAVLVTARTIGTARLNRLVPGPLSVTDPSQDPSEMWTESELAQLLFDERWGLYEGGTGLQPGGYFPKKKSGVGGVATAHPITGRLEDSASAAFWTLSLRSPWLYLYVWPDRDCYIDGGDDGGLLIQIDEGA